MRSDLVLPVPSLSLNGFGIVTLHCHGGVFCAVFLSEVADTGSRFGEYLVVVQ
jgi:hypothetical protein